MREYIIEGADWAIDFTGESMFKGCEEIVRCRDCKRVTIDQRDHDYREPLWCGLFRTDVRLDGFCAWGERKEVGE